MAANTVNVAQPAVAAQVAAPRIVVELGSRSTVALVAKEKRKTSQSESVVTRVYVLLAVASVIVCVIAELGLSALLTMSAMAQSVACLFLALQAHSAAGSGMCSGRSAFLLALSSSCRLSSSLWLNGYLPADIAGDGFYQAVDIFALIAALFVLMRLAFTGDPAIGPATRADGRGGVAELVLGVCVALAAAGLFHGDMDRRPLFDTLWLAGVFFGAAAGQPQLRLLAEAEGGPDGDRGTRGATSVVFLQHHVLALGLSQLLGAIYVWHAQGDIISEPWIGDINHTAYAVLAAHLAHLVLACDVLGCRTVPGAED